jgi:hypothetical protein
MFDRLEIFVLPADRRFPAQLRFRVNGEDVVEQAVGTEGRGPVATAPSPTGDPSPLRATPAPRRVQLGEPECTGGCCGYLSAVVRRVGNVVQWTDWEVPDDQAPPTEFDFDADAYDAEVARAESVSGWQGLS